MENMDKGLTVPKWVLIVWPKIPQMTQNLSAQFVCPSQKVLHFSQKRLHWASVVRIFNYHYDQKKLIKVWDMARYINEGDKIVDKIQPELI